MDISQLDLQERVVAVLAGRGFTQAPVIGWACAWLEACGYPGVKMLAEALGDQKHELELVRDTLGFDLHNVSCTFLAPAIAREVGAHGRVFLRNVRHGLYVLPFTVRDGIGIGCPIDPSFAVGGERSKNPYADKLEQARLSGIAVDDALWASLTG